MMQTSKILFETRGSPIASRRPDALMKKAKDAQSAVLSANQAFYTAFSGADSDGMAEVWGQTGTIAVEHPGMCRIFGRAEVLRSWRIILRAPPPVIATVEDVIEDEDQWAVICQEDLGRVIIRMVNVFHEEERSWKMIYHGPAPERRLSS